MTYICQVQFLKTEHIDQLRTIASDWNVPVIAYGLRTDFRTNLFPGSARLVETSYLYMRIYLCIKVYLCI
jgi:thymidine kinase